MRGMQNLLMDFYDHPDFVHEFLNAIADYNIAQVNEALKYDIDAVYFGDDWGQQRGLQMGPKLWRKFILPVLKRMYGAVHAGDKYVFIHSCGDVDELFDDLIDIGLNCFNPFQPEVMDVESFCEADTAANWCSTADYRPKGPYPMARWKRSVQRPAACWNGPGWRLHLCPGTRCRRRCCPWKICWLSSMWFKASQTIETIKEQTHGHSR